MILYNVTVKIDQKLESDWLEWIQAVHIPDMLATGLFSEHKLCKITFPTDDDGGVTYAIQYFTESMDTLREYQTKFAKKLQAEHQERYKDRYVAIRTLMEVLSS